MGSRGGNLFGCSSYTYHYRISLPTLVVISLSLILRFDYANSVQPTQGAKVPHQQSPISKDRSEDGETVGSSSAGKYSSGSKSYASSPSSSSYYTYPPTSPYNGYYLPAAAEPYYDGYYERPARQFSARSSTYPMVAAATSQVGFAEPEYGGMTAATGHGHGHGHGHSGHGHGGGWSGHGWSGHGGGHHTTYYESVSKVDTSSLGLLGLLGLLSLLSNVLLLITTTAAAAPAPAPAPTRRRRDLNYSTNEYNSNSEEDNIERVCQMILPSLNIVGHAQNGRIPVNCTHQEVCKANKILVNEFGVHGRTVGSMLSTAIQKMLREVDESSTVDKYLLKASLDGRNGKDCETLFPKCEALEKGTKALPQLISPEHVYAIVHGKNPHLVASEISKHYDPHHQ